MSHENFPKPPEVPVEPDRRIDASVIGGAQVGADIVNAGAAFKPEQTDELLPVASLRLALHDVAWQSIEWLAIRGKSQNKRTEPEHEQPEDFFAMPGIMPTAAVAAHTIRYVTSKPISRAASGYAQNMLKMKSLSGVCAFFERMPETMLPRGFKGVVSQVVESFAQSPFRVLQKRGAIYVARDLQQITLEKPPEKPGQPFEEPKQLLLPPFTHPEVAFLMDRIPLTEADKVEAARIAGLAKNKDLDQIDSATAKRFLEVLSTYTGKRALWSELLDHALVRQRLTKQEQGLAGGTWVYRVLGDTQDQYHKMIAGLHVSLQRMLTQPVYDSLMHELVGGEVEDSMKGRHFPLVYWDKDRLLFKRTLPKWRLVNLDTGIVTGDNT